MLTDATLRRKVSAFFLTDYLRVWMTVLGLEAFVEGKKPWDSSGAPYGSSAGFAP
jgi:hypothetical protein